MDVLESTFFGNTLQNWSVGLLVCILVITGMWLARKLIVYRLGALASTTETHLDDMAIELLKQTKWWMLLIVGVYVGSLFVELTDHARNIVNRTAAVALIVQAGIWLSTILGLTLERSRQRQLEKDPASVTTLNAIGFISKLVLWTVVLLLTLDNLGFNVTALVAGLGVGGIAVALALQTILGDLFASLSIVLDKPFAVGDFLIIDDYLGSVEHVGLKTTRMRSLSGEQLVFSNSDLLGSRIRNYGRMYQRRVDFTIGVTYQTPRDKLKLIPTILQEAIESQEQTRFDRSHFAKYGDFSLNFETVYFVLVSDYNTYMDIQQAINLHIHERFEAEGIEFAYPTQTLFVHSPAAAGA